MPSTCTRSTAKATTCICATTHGWRISSTRTGSPWARSDARAASPYAVAGTRSRDSKREDAILLTKTKRVIAERDGPIGWITFNNPERHNAMSIDMWEALPEILDAYESDPAIRVVVMKGAGQKAFVSGADISEFETARSNAERVAHYEAITDKAMVHAYHLSKPAI